MKGPTFGARTSRGAIAVVAGMALVATACSPAAERSEQPSCTWTIGIMGAIEDDWAEFGQPPARGVQVAVDLANENGELACALETHSENTGGDPKEAPVHARRLVNDEDLVACVCGYFSGETLATGDIFDRGGVAMLSTEEQSGTRSRGFDTWFRLVAPADRQASATARYISRVMAPRRVVIVSDYLPYSKDVAKTVAEELGWRFEPPVVRLVSEENRDEVASREILRTSADLVFFAGYASQAWPLLGYMGEQGDKDLRVPFVTDGGSMYEPEAREADAGHALLSCGCSDAAELDTAEAFVAEYRARYDTDPGHFAPDAFDGTNVVIDALSELDGSESTEEVRAHVIAHLEEAEDVEGTVKHYTWDEDGELVTDDGDVWMWEWRRRGGFRMLGSVAELTR